MPTTPARRRDGVNGWAKCYCPYSRTEWAWEHPNGACTCKPCKPPRIEIDSPVIPARYTTRRELHVKGDA